MAQADVFDLELAWDLMTPMEQALYGTTFALHAHLAEQECQTTRLPIGHRK